MAVIIDLEDAEGSPSPSPRSSKKRSYDGTILGDRAVPYEPALEKLLDDAISNSSAAEDQAVCSVAEGESSGDDSDEELLQEEEIKDLLQVAIDSIDSHPAGSFAASGVLPSAANPGLSIQGLGGIGLPLSEHDADRLAASSLQVPVEQENPTAVDTPVVKMWEFDPSLLELRNPAWQQTLTGALTKVANDLGIAAGIGGIRAELCKLSLYGDGAGMELPTDSEKALGFLGTLQILLPSSHKGGAVEVSFGGEQRLLESALSSDFCFSYIAWYADVEHRLREITSGYRLFLTYDLIHQGQGTPQCAASLVKDKQKITHALKEWQTFHRRENRYWPLAYTLEHDYAEPTLRLDCLKGKAQIQAQIVQKACQEQGFAFFLANIEQTVFGTCEETYHYRRNHYYDSEEDDEHHSIEDETGRIVELKVVALPNGSVCARAVDFEMENILEYEPFNEDPDEEDYDSGEVTHYHRRSCFLIMPEDSQDKLFFEPAVGSVVETRDLLGDLVKSLELVKSESPNPVSNSSPHPSQIRLEKFCKYIITGNHHLHDGFLYEELISIALLLDQPSIFLMIVRSTTDNISLSTYRKIGSALPFKVFEPFEWQKGAAIAARKFKRVFEIWAALTELVEGVKASLKDVSNPGKVGVDSMSAWMYSTITANLPEHSALVNSDAEALAKIALRHEDCERFLLCTLVPYIKKNVVNKSATLTFLGTIFDSYKENRIREEVVIELYRDAMNDLGPDLFKAEEPESYSKRPKYTATPVYGRPSISHTYGSEPPALSLYSRLEPREVANLVGQCLSLGLKNEVQSVLREIANKCEYYPVAAFDSTWITFLRYFLDTVKSLPDPTFMEYRNFFQGTINCYIRRYLGEEPPTPIIMTPIRRGCGCSPCLDLDRFLLDPKQETGRFRYNKPIREHLEKQIGRYYKHTTDTAGSPYTLVVQKNEAEYKAKRAVADYKARCGRTRGNLFSIGVTALNKLLGTSGDDLTNFKSVRNKLIAAGRGTRVPLVNVSQPANGPMPPTSLSLAEAGKHLTTNASHSAKDSASQNMSMSTTKRPDYILEMNKLCELRRLKPMFGTNFQKDSNGPGNHHYGILSLMDTNKDVSKVVYPIQSEHFTTEMSLRQNLAQKACVWLK